MLLRFSFEWLAESFVDLYVLAKEIHIAVEGLEATKGSVYFLSEGQVTMVKSDKELDVGPEVFDLVEVRRVARQREKPAADFFDQGAQLLHWMEGRVVQNDNLSRQKNWTQLLLEPRLDERAVAVALKGQGRKHLSGAPRGGHRDALCSVPQPLGQTPLSFRTPAVAIVQGVIHARLIHIDPRFEGHTS